MVSLKNTIPHYISFIASLGERACLYLAVAFGVTATIFSIDIALHNTGISNSIFLAVFAVLVTVLIFSYRLELTSKKNIVITLLLALIARSIWALYFPTEQTSDFIILLNASKSAASGDFEFSKMEYFQDWAYQYGFVAYQAAALLLTANSEAVLKLLNACYITLSCLAVYGIAKELFDRKAAFVSMAAYAIYLPTLYSSSLLTNQHLATFLFLSSAWTMIRKPSLMGVAVAGALAGLGNIIRPLGPVFLLGAAIYFFLLTANTSTISQALRKLLIVPAFFLTYATAIALVTLSINATGMHDGQLSNNNPYWKFVIGLNHDTSGRYSMEDYTLVAGIKDIDERSAVQKELIAERLSDTSAVLDLFGEKYMNMWGERDSLVYWSFQGTDLDEYHLIANSLMTSQYSLYLFLFTLAMLGINRRAAVVLLVSIIVAYVAVHFLIEIQTRYRYFAMPFICVFIGHGVKNLLTIISRLRPSPLT